MLGCPIEQRDVADVECETHLARKPPGALRRAEMRCDPHWHQPSVSAPIGSMNSASASMIGPRRLVVTERHVLGTDAENNLPAVVERGAEGVLGAKRGL